MEFNTRGTTIHYDITGSGEKRVVLLHGWGCSMELMARTRENLETDMTVLTLDFPMHGQSGKPPVPWGVSDFGEAVKELLEHERFLPCGVVAHSFGGRVVTYLASEYPDMFTRIVFTGAAGIRKPQTEEGKKRTEEYKKLREKWEKLSKVPFLKGAAEKAQEALRQKYGSADYNALDEEGRKTFVKVITEDLSDRLEKIQAPTLLLWGDQDTETPMWMAQQMEKSIPDCALIPLVGGTHFAYLEQYPRFNAIIHPFLKEA